jgi:hypothetical protein
MGFFHYEDTDDPAPLPAVPCPYAPGTPEKMAWLQNRVGAREQLHHPLDARADREGDALGSCGTRYSERHGTPRGRVLAADRQFAGE